MDIKSIITRIVEKKLEKDSDDPCWDGYVQLGTKKKGGKEVPNCVPKESVELDEAVELTEEVHNDLNDAIIEFQKKLMRMTRQLDPTIAKEIKKIDKDLDDLRTGPLFKIRPGR
jgi:hypothetical protein